jgi:hypothetical protein
MIGTVSLSAPQRNAAVYVLPTRIELDPPRLRDAAPRGRVNGSLSRHLVHRTGSLRTGHLRSKDARVVAPDLFAERKVTRALGMTARLTLDSPVCIARSVRFPCAIEVVLGGVGHVSGGDVLGSAGREHNDSQVTHVSDRLAAGDEGQRRVQQSLQSRRIELDAADGQLDAHAVARSVHDQHFAVTRAVAVELDSFGHQTSLFYFAKTRIVNACKQNPHAFTEGS